MRHLALLSIAFLAGCSANLDTESTGNLGNATFSYQSSQCGILDCGTDQSVLQGSLVTVRATVDRSRPVARAAFPTSAVGRIADQRPSCEPSDSNCDYFVDIETRAAGDGELDLYDAKGALIDKIAVRVKPASRIDVDVKLGDQAVTAKDGVYEIPQGAEVKLHAVVYGDADERLVFTQHGVAHDYSDKSIVRPVTFELLGDTDVEIMEAEKTGEMSVTTHAPGAQSIAKFRVLP